MNFSIPSSISKIRSVSPKLNDLRMLKVNREVEKVIRQNANVHRIRTNLASFSSGLSIEKSSVDSDCNSPQNKQLVKVTDKRCMMDLRTLVKNSKPISIKESSIPLDILFNKEINEIKIEEQLTLQKPKPITFRILNQVELADTQEQIATVRFEIEGGGKAIDMSFIRKNELEFFEFVQEFNQNNKNNDNVSRTSMTSVPIWKRRRSSKEYILQK